MAEEKLWGRKNNSGRLGNMHLFRRESEYVWLSVCGTVTAKNVFLVEPEDKTQGCMHCWRKAP
jgi:hypothetical protein